jgi:nitrate reductase gamma subunit
MDKFTYFWILIIVGMNFFFIGVYKNFVAKIGFILWVNDKTRKGGEGPTWLDTLKGLWPSNQTIVDEALLQRRIKNRSYFLWSRHALIFFGFMIIFALDVFLTFAGHYVHHYFHIDYFMTGPGKAFLKVGMELSGLLLFVGLTLGLLHRAMYAKDEKKFVDIRLLWLLWGVTLTGFFTEAFRLAATPNDPLMAFSFIGGPIAKQLMVISKDWALLADWMWILHATITVFFFAYLPFSKFIHVISAPVGRSITQNGEYAIQKRQRISEGLL